jgi:hypothetical protein
MLLSFDVAPEAIAEHDEWHTHEHLPERLAIPGIHPRHALGGRAGATQVLRAVRVESLGTLASEAYLERLNHPTPWTSKMMLHYRGMTRGFCSIEASSGFGMGHAACSCASSRNRARSRRWPAGFAATSLPSCRSGRVSAAFTCCAARSRRR